MVRLSASRVAVPTNPKADEPSHPTIFAPRSAIRGPISTPPSSSCAIRPGIGLLTTLPVICWAGLTMTPANDTPGTDEEQREHGNPPPAALEPRAHRQP